MEEKAIPRMRTAANIVAEIKAMDPETELTEFHIRKLVKDGVIPSLKSGRKTLINLNDVLDLLQRGMPQSVAEAAPTVRGIRRIDPRLA